MGVGGRKEERHFDFQADAVFERLLNVLTQDGCEIESSDKKVRAVVANGVMRSRWIPWATSPARVSAAVDAVDGQKSRVTLESAPAYKPTLYAEKIHRRNADRLFGLLANALSK
jgi:hypothetical protein